jgi:hypothetical protein
MFCTITISRVKQTRIGVKAHTIMMTSDLRVSSDLFGVDAKADSILHLTISGDLKVVSINKCSLG